MLQNIYKQDQVKFWFLHQLRYNFSAEENKLNLNIYFSLAATSCSQWTNFHFTAMKRASISMKSREIG